MTTNELDDEFDHNMRGWLERRRKERRERVQTAAMWAAVIAALSSPFVTYVLTH